MQGTGRPCDWLAGQPASTIGSMEAGTRELSGEKAQRIVDAMRASVGARGAAGATFDHVAREAGKAMGEWLEGRGRLDRPIHSLTLPDLEAMAQNAISTFIVKASERISQHPDESGSRKLSILLG